MKEEHNKINRRSFLKTVGAAGLGSALAATGGNSAWAKEESGTKYPQVPKRVLGKTGVKVSCLSHGLMYNVVDNQIILRKALEWGVSNWDSASSYGGGNSERGIGQYLAKNPAIRKNLFLVTKASKARSVGDFEGQLQQSLKRMNTSYIDLYFKHGLGNPNGLSDELRKWVASAKKRKLIRFFGFSAHVNVAPVLAAAAKAGWVDAAMPKYNFRMAHDAEMQDAIEACYKAGVGLIAMKSQARPSKKKKEIVDTEKDRKLIGHFLARGFTEGQAKIKAVLEDKRFSAVCVTMKSISLLTENIAAALDKTKLSQADKDVLAQYARETCDGYCAGCAEICDSALPQAPYVSDVMRYLMYYNSYGDKEKARQLFAEIPGSVRAKLAKIDYSTAEARCPQHMPIAKLMAEAARKLA